MNSLHSLVSRCLAQSLFGAVLVALGFVSAMTPRAVAQCSLPEQPSGPAAGQYKGYFRVTYEMHPPGGGSSLVIPIKIEGDLSFKLGRQDLSDPPPPVTPPPYKRPPLRPPSTTSNPPSEQAAVDAVAEAATAQAALDAASAKGGDGYLYIAPSENPRVEGTSNLTIGASFQQGGAAGQLTGQVASSQSQSFDIRGEESSRTGTFDELGLWGTQEQFPMSGGFNLSGPGAQGTGAFDFGANGGTGRVTGTSDQGSVTRDVTIATSGGSGPTPPEDKYQRERRKFDEAYDRLFGKPVNKVKMLTLKVTDTSCGSLRGTVRAEEFEENLKKQGGSLVVKESEWVATLEEREPQFEQKVQSMMAEPIPTPITWAYIDSFSDRWKAIRQEANTDYKRCVAKDLLRKYVDIQVAALSELSRNVPKARDGANAVVLRAALERSLPIIRSLQLFGVGDCPVVRGYWANLEREVQAVLKDLLGRNPSPSDLARYLGIASYVDFGDQSEPFWNAWGQVEAAAAQRHP